jgi:hypothetical protein
LLIVDTVVVDKSNEKLNGNEYQKANNPATGIKDVHSLPTDLVSEKDQRLLALEGATV